MTSCQEDDRVLFKLATAKKRVLPELERRQAQTNLSRNLRYMINTALEDERAQTQPAEEASVSTDSTATRKRGRCCICPRQKDNKTTMRCSLRNSSVCSRNAKKQLICLSCQK
ncbi:hypothetical protein ElyMa_006816400 [Elysia marginata]|uniref:SERTA domain-containing protein n=1 Tax=Elysia marginata TaxID=1093978 RepID=A0AAV4J5F2_9GAST|nr:hypothetical protein ElyMa_006816400 [Elysia marginata]